MISIDSYYRQPETLGYPTQKQALPYAYTHTIPPSADEHKLSMPFVIRVPDSFAHDAQKNPQKGTFYMK